MFTKTTQSEGQARVLTPAEMREVPSRPSQEELENLRRQAHVERPEVPQK